MRSGPQRGETGLRWRATLLRAMAVLVVAALTIGALEIVSSFGLRHLGPARRARWLAAADGNWAEITTALSAVAPELNPTPMVPDATLLWRNAASATRTQVVNPAPYDRDETWTLRTNADGYRGPDLTPCETGCYRVLCIGDSVTFGFNVDQGREFPRRLEALLRARHPDRDIQVVNAAVPGWTWAQGVRFLEIEGLGLHPDVVVIGHGTNDQFFPARITDLEQMRTASTRRGQAITSLVGLVRRSRTYWLAAMLHPPTTPRPSPACEAQMRASGACRRVSLPEIEELVGTARKLTAAAGADLVIVNVDFMATRAVEGARAAAARDGVPFLDFVDDFRALGEKEDAARAARLGLSPGTTTASSGSAHRLVLRVTDLPPGSRASVGGESYLLGSFRFDEPLVDDGTRGDETAGDGVFSVTVDVPGEVDVVAYRFFRDGIPELRPMPPVPSRAGDRLVTVRADTLAPIASFGHLGLMAERVHPNAAGHERIAERLAERLP